MIFKKMPKNIKFIKILIIFVFLNNSLSANVDGFDKWLQNFKERAIKAGISKVVVEDIMTDARFLPKVIEYDRYQPEFYEDTYTYVKKRSNSKKIKKGVALYKKEKLIIDKIETEFLVEKELLLSLMGIETNFGKYLGKMDIVSSLATLSYDEKKK